MGGKLVVQLIQPLVHQPRQLLVHVPPQGVAALHPLPDHAQPLQQRPGPADILRLGDHLMGVQRRKGVGQHSAAGLPGQPLPPAVPAQHPAQLVDARGVHLAEQQPARQAAPLPQPGGEGPGGRALQAEAAQQLLRPRPGHGGHVLHGLLVPEDVPQGGQVVHGELLQDQALRLQMHRYHSRLSSRSSSPPDRGFSAPVGRKPSRQYQS